MKLIMGSCKAILGFLTWGTKYKLNSERSPQKSLYNPGANVIPLGLTVFSA